MYKGTEENLFGDLFLMKSLHAVVCMAFLYLYQKNELRFAVCSGTGSQNSGHGKYPNQEGLTVSGKLNQYLLLFCLSTVGACIAFGVNQ